MKKRSRPKMAPPMPQSREPLSSYRWAIEALLFLTLICQTLIWLAPAPILDPIMRSLRLSLGQAGLIVSIIALCIAAFSMLGALVMERMGALRSLLLGLWIMAGAQFMSGYSRSFAELLGWRVGEGIGFGLLIAPPGALVMQWFGEREWPYINMFNALCSYVGLTAVYAVTARLYLASASSWNAVLRYYGILCLVVAMLWTLFGREHRRCARESIATNPPSTGREPVLREIMRMRNIVLVAIGLFGGMWVFQFYATFLPQYFHEYRAMGLAQASAITSVLPLAGIFAAAGGGFATGLTGLRKPFTWPVALLTLAGSLGAVLLPSQGWIMVALVTVGIGAAGSLAPITTLVMELPGMTPEKMGTALAFVWSVGYGAAFVSPFLGGAIASLVGLRAVMLGFLAFQALPIIAMYLLPETGPRRARPIADRASAS
jgi:CP family cyanate transporter-like MFS transporter